MTEKEIRIELIKEIILRKCNEKMTLPLTEEGKLLKYLRKKHLNPNDGNDNGITLRLKKYNTVCLKGDELYE